MIYCCECRQDVSARLTTGKEVYPHLAQLKHHPFWICDDCKNYVGCHHKTEHRTRPLGCIPTQQMRKARMRLHNLIDPIWKSGTLKRVAVYQRLATALGRKSFHTAETRSLEELEQAYDAAKVAFKKELTCSST